jgi:serine/threonine-protein kinase RsbW
MPEPVDDIAIRLLDAHEAPSVVDAIRAVYGDSYDVPWLYDATEISRRIAHGQMISGTAFGPDGALLCHAALTRHDHDDQVVHSGQAVSLPAARGQHLFTRVKAFLAAWATDHGVLGIYSEATAAHPYSQRANLDLGATETGVLLAWIPATVDNDASVLATAVRASVVLFYLRTNRAPTHPLYAPLVYREMVRTIVDRSGMRGRLATAPRRLALAPHTKLHTEIDAPHNTAIVHVDEAGADLASALIDARDRCFARGIDVVYADLRLDQPTTEIVGDDVRAAGFRFAGVFPSPRHRGENLRTQALRPGVRVSADDVSVASDHGRELLDFVLADSAGESRP